MQKLTKTTLGGGSAGAAGGGAIGLSSFMADDPAVMERFARLDAMATLLERVVMGAVPPRAPPPSSASATHQQRQQQQTAQQRQQSEAEAALERLLLAHLERPARLRVDPRTGRLYMPYAATHHVPDSARPPSDTATQGYAASLGGTNTRLGSSGGPAAAAGVGRHNNNLADPGAAGSRGALNDTLGSAGSGGSYDAGGALGETASGAAVAGILAALGRSMRRALQELQQSVDECILSFYTHLKRKTLAETEQLTERRHVVPPGFRLFTSVNDNGELVLLGGPSGGGGGNSARGANKSSTRLGMGFNNAAATSSSNNASALPSVRQPAKARITDGSSAAGNDAAGDDPMSLALPRVSEAAALASSAYADDPHSGRSRGPPSTAATTARPGSAAGADSYMNMSTATTSGGRKAPLALRLRERRAACSQMQLFLYLLLECAATQADAVSAAVYLNGETAAAGANGSGGAGAGNNSSNNNNSSNTFLVRAAQSSRSIAGTEAGGSARNNNNKSNNSNNSNRRSRRADGKSAGGGGAYGDSDSDDDFDNNNNNTGAGGRRGEDDGEQSPQEQQQAAAAAMQPRFLYQVASINAEGKLPADLSYATLSPLTSVTQSGVALNFRQELNAWESEHDDGDGARGAAHGSSRADHQKGATGASSKALRVQNAIIVPIHKVGCVVLADKRIVSPARYGSAGAGAASRTRDFTLSDEHVAWSTAQLLEAFLQRYDRSLLLEFAWAPAAGAVAMQPFMKLPPVGEAAAPNTGVSAAALRALRRSNSNVHDNNGATGGGGGLGARAPPLRRLDSLAAAAGMGAGGAGETPSGERERAMMAEGQMEEVIARITGRPAGDAGVYARTLVVVRTADRGLKRMAPPEVLSRYAATTTTTGAAGGDSSPTGASANNKSSGREFGAAAAAPETTAAALDESELFQAAAQYIENLESLWQQALEEGNRREAVAGAAERAAQQQQEKIVELEAKVRRLNARVVQLERPDRFVAPTH